ncbi:MAG: carbamoyltransferase N-terminal domain-containing protein, partial [Candidatus Bathyarchaeota archaeon]
MTSIRIVGIHDNHNASVCLLEDGVIRFAVQEERITRKKNYTGFPYRSLQMLLEYSSLTIEDIDLFAFGQIHNPPQYSKEERLRWYGSSGSSKSKFIEVFRRSPFFSFYKSASRKQRLRQMQQAGIPREKALFVDHHLAHASASYYGSFYDKNVERVLVLTLDGGGDGLCSSVYVGENGFLNKMAETKEGNSIGNVYSRTTFYMGMTPLEHEYKLMGMAPYAKGEYYSQIYEELRKLLYVDELVFKRRTLFSTFGIYPALRRIYTRERFDNISGALQRFTEDLILTWVRTAARKTGIRKLALGGGVFMNVKANKKIMELEEVENVFVFPSCGDESCSIGAAFHVYSQMCSDEGKETGEMKITNLYRGPEYSDKEIEGELEEVVQSNEIKYTRCKDVGKTIAEMLTENKIVARFYGKLEWGARALGNRSILANASNFLNVRHLNRAIKRRDFWMPFAPTMLKERQDDYLVNPKNITAPYMVLAFDTTRKRDDIIAAVHPADLTARPQVLSTEDNSRYCVLLKKYE